MDTASTDFISPDSLDPDQVSPEAPEKPVPDPAAMTAFFQALYGDAEEGYLVLSRLDPDPMHCHTNGKRWLQSTWLNLATTSLDQAGQIAASKGTSYFSVVLQAPGTEKKGRGKHGTAWGVPGLWFDCDIATGHHAASTLPASLDEAITVLQDLPTPPNLTVATGGGIHGYWRFKEPYRIDTEDDRAAIRSLSQRLHLTLMHLGKAQGWTLDNTSELARVLRPAGSINEKYGCRVHVIADTPHRYNPADFDTWLDPLPLRAITTHHGEGIAGQPALAAIAAHYGCALVSHGAELVGSHPMHGSSTGTNLSLNPDKGLWHCWRHGTGGDALAFLAVCAEKIPCEEMRPGALHGDLFKEMVHLANDRFGCAIPIRHRAPEPGPETAPFHEESYPYSDASNAQELLLAYGAKLRYVPAWKTWLIWTGTHWQRDTHHQALRWQRQTVKGLGKHLEGTSDDTAAKALLGHIKSSLSTSRLKAALEQAQSWEGISVDAEACDADPWLLNCHNGTLELRTGTLRPHAPHDLLTKCLAIDYDSNTRCPMWDMFLWRIMGGTTLPDTREMSAGELEMRHMADTRAQALIEFLARIVGYGLTGSTREQCLFILHGVTKTGKSTFLSTIRALMGPYGQEANVSTFMKKDKESGANNDLADLAGSRFVCAVESKENQKLAEALVKQMTGGSDHLKARFLFQEYFRFKPQFKIFLGTNHKPIIKDADGAIWERIRLIPFVVQIPPDERDKTLDETLLTELPGILAWAVRGCREWQAKKELQEPKEVLDATAGYRAEQDVLGNFLEECCVVLQEAKVKSSVLYKAYQTWCPAKDDTMTQKSFSQRLENKGYTCPHTKTGNFWHGIGLLQKGEGL